MSLIESIESPADLRKLDVAELDIVASELREFIIDNVSVTGGHLASSLGAVDLTIAVHYVFDTPKDKIIFDVGHQCYAHKILTGRKRMFSTLRQYGGISGFPNRRESEFDTFGVGHAGTAIAAALGMVAARDIKGTGERVAAIVGDGALSSGIAWEGLNNASQMNSDIVIIINDNEMSISPSLGAISTYLSKASSGRIYTSFRNIFERTIKGAPILSETILKMARKFEVSLKLLSPGLLFEEMGFRYFGPINGHNIKDQVTMLRNVKSLKGPVILHIITKKGKGYKPAEDDPVKFHGIGAFDKQTGQKKAKSSQTYSLAAAAALSELFKHDNRSIAISAAMLEGTGLSELKLNFPDRVFDVGIAEQHAVTFAAGLSSSGIYSYVVLYSTFLQRAYDSVIHDAALQNLPMTFLIDRAGIVGADGATHNGIFDIAYLLPIPNLILMAPADKDELANMIKFSRNLLQPAAIRYPRGEAELLGITHKQIEIGTASVEREGSDMVMFAYGSMVKVALEAAEALKDKKIMSSVINLRFIKPIDKNLIMRYANSSKAVMVLEEGSEIGGVGELISFILLKEKIYRPIKIVAIKDKFVVHGKQDLMRSMFGLDIASVVDCALSLFRN